MTLRTYDLAQPWFTSDDHWRAYFQTLARARLNRLSLMLPLAEADIERLRMLSETAAEYGVDFVLGIRHLEGDPQELYARLRGILDACPLIRGVEIEAGDESVQLYQEGVFKALHESGRRVMLDLRNADDRPDLVRAASVSGTPLSTPGFEMDAPGPDFMGDHQPALLGPRAEQLRRGVPDSQIVHAATTYAVVEVEFDRSGPDHHKCRGLADIAAA